jgi:micrococcal nuclease
VVDGDTIEVEMDGRRHTVRYIGIDTPEVADPRRPVMCYGEEASRRNRQLVEGKTILLEKDVSETDRYGRLLRYVWADGVFVNAALVREGYARVYTVPPDVRYAELFRRLEREAREQGRGLWGACPAPSAPAGQG